MKKIIVHGFFFALVLFVTVRTIDVIEPCRRIGGIMIFDYSPDDGSFFVCPGILEFVIALVVLAFLYKIARDFIKG